jgi:membrane-associated phospholipid phosphatase
MDNADRIAGWVSALLSNPVVGMVFGYTMGLSETQSAWGFADQGIAVLSALFLGIFPYVGALVSFLAGKTDIYVSNREQRPALFLVAVPPMGLGALYFYVRGLPILSSLLLLMLVESLILLVITTRWKISIHVSGLTFPLTVIWVRDGVTAIVGFLLLPVLMWARVRMGAHTWMQVLASALLSGVMTYCGAVTFLPSFK